MARPPSFVALVIAALLVAILGPVMAASCHSEDKKALLAIKQFWNNPNYLATWVPSTDCCNWRGVTCEIRTGRVTDLEFFDDENITGTIPPALGDLRYLVSLNIRKLPHVTGSIPLSLARLRNLNFLRLDGNDLTGPVPTFLAQLPGLWYLNLGSNRLTGFIPSDLGLTKIRYLALDHNRLTGPVPAEFGNLPVRTTLLLSHNSLSGPLPPSLGNVDFSDIDLSWNHLFGDATFLFGQNKVQLSTIDLSRNAFEFDFGKVVFPSAAEEFQTIKLNNNRIYGRIPKQIANLTSLVTLDLSYNRLCGEIPTGVILDRFEAEVYAHNRCLCGKPLPPCK